MENKKVKESSSSRHAGIFGMKIEMVFAILCGSFLILGFALSFVNSVHDYFSIASYLLAYFFGGFYATIEAYQGVSKGKFDIDFLMIVAAAGAAILGHWAEGALLLFFIQPRSGPGTLCF